MKQRIIGFDLARAYAIFGMYIVNFNIVFGNFNDREGLGYILSMFSGNSASVFVMLAGMGVALMSNRNTYNRTDKLRIKNTILKRALFLFITGLLLQIWWPADILHFYGGYMSIAALFIFANKKYFVWLSVVAIIVFHVLFALIPFDTNWNFTTVHYQGFWTLQGFFLNYFYNGWNAIFPWLAFFTTGLYLGRLNWQEAKTQKKIFLMGLFIYLIVTAIQLFINEYSYNQYLKDFMNADYLPPFLPFILSTMSFGLMLIATFMYLGNIASNKQWALVLANTGRMTLTHYVSHLTIGILIFTHVFNKDYTGQAAKQGFVAPEYILLFSLVYFVVSVLFSKLWFKKFKNGPLETIMRKVSG